jgi:hypothetical protein
MGYVYQQQPMPTTFTGVPVTISVLDSNGNHYTIGTAMTDSSGSYSLTFTPSIPGNFTVYANFEGTQGYWPSSAETHFYYVPQAAATAQPTTSPQQNLATTSDLMTYMTIGVIVIVIAIAIVGLLQLRKRP